MGSFSWRPAVTIALVVVSAGCGFNSSSVGFNISREVAEQVVQGDPIAHAAGGLFGQSPINPFMLNIDLSAEASANGNVAVQRVLLQSMAFTVTATEQPSGDSDCWDFVRSVTVFVESTNSGTSLQRTRIAEANEPGCVQTLDITPVPGVNLKPFIEEGVRVVVEATGIPPADNVSFNGRVVVRAEPLP